MKGFLLAAGWLAFVACDGEPGTRRPVSAKQEITADGRPLLPSDGFDGVPMASILLTDGDVLAVDSRSGQLVFFDSAGSIRHVTGGRGEGPGSFVDVSDAFEMHEGIGLYDQTLRRMTMIADDGQFLWTRLIDQWQGRDLRIVGAMDSTLVGIRNRADEQTSSEHVFVVDSVEVLTGALDDTPTPVLTLPGKVVLRIVDRGVPRDIPVPSPTTFISVCRNGFRVVRDSLIEVYDRMGRRLDQLVNADLVAHTQAGVPQSRIEQLTAHLSPSGRSTARQLLRNRLQDSQLSSKVAMVGAQGDVWIRESLESFRFIRLLDSTPDVAITVPGPIFWLHARGNRLLGISPEFDDRGTALLVFDLPPAGLKSTTDGLESCGRAVRI